eukprot:TRINITY_DN7216_c0_g1_i1.p1 TRINITY_DN7216_c0_g1~~TRINITY_DN7216_c0_g1_i1.p1  ORF type:complete len:200 (-),score=37.25 TRINITY_DN7216_c0_g1_i1:92-691(-)
MLCKAMVLPTYMLVWLAVALSQPASGDSSVEIISKLKTFRDSAIEIFDTAASSLETAGKTSKAAEVRAWSNDWLSVLGVSKGITGCVGDFLTNYFGRSAYHDNNGKFLNHIKKLASYVPTWDKPDADDFETFRSGLLSVSAAGKNLFKANGALHSMLHEMEALLMDEVISKHMSSSLRASPQLKEAFEYMAGNDAKSEL